MVKKILRHHSFARAFSYYVKKNRWMATLLALMIATACVLIWQSTGHLMQGGAIAVNFKLAFLGGLGCAIATGFGSVPAFFFRRISKTVENSLLGFSAGMMLAATAFSLLLPGLKAAETLLNSKEWAGLVLVFGMILGMFLILGIDVFTPHMHKSSGPCGPGYQAFNRLWLFVFAIALHNLPEGMAVGVSFSQGDMNVGLPFSLAIALQDIPEGFAVALSLRSIGLTATRSVLYGAATGLIELVGAIFGFGLSSGMAIAYPICLGLAGGAMLFVVSHEVIPETHRLGQQKAATISLIFGFALMMLMDTCLG